MVTMQVGHTWTSGLIAVVRPSVEAANRLAPTFARIFKDMIIVTDSARPLPLAGKGTIVRPQAIQLYASDIDKLCVIQCTTMLVIADVTLRKVTML